MVPAFRLLKLTLFLILWYKWVGLDLMGRGGYTQNTLVLNWKRYILNYLEYRLDSVKFRTA
jgi:hypothetical protein